MTIQRNTPSSPDPPLDPVDRLHRIRSFVGCLRDSFDVAGRDYSTELGERTWLCDYVSDELCEYRGGVGAGVVYAQGYEVLSASQLLLD